MLIFWWVRHYVNLSRSHSQGDSVSIQVTHRASYRDSQSLRVEPYQGICVSQTEKEETQSFTFCFGRGTAVTCGLLSVCQWPQSGMWSTIPFQLLMQRMQIYSICSILNMLYTRVQLYCVFVSYLFFVSCFVAFASLPLNIVSYFLLFQFNNPVLVHQWPLRLYSNWPLCHVTPLLCKYILLDNRRHLSQHGPWWYFVLHKHSPRVEPHAQIGCKIQLCLAECLSVGYTIQRMIQCLRPDTSIIMPFPWPCLPHMSSYNLRFAAT